MKLTIGINLDLSGKTSRYVGLGLEYDKALFEAMRKAEKQFGTICDSGDFAGLTSIEFRYLRHFRRSQGVLQIQKNFDIWGHLKILNKADSKVLLSWN